MASYDMNSCEPLKTKTIVTIALKCFEGRYKGRLEHLNHQSSRKPTLWTGSKLWGVTAYIFSMSNLALQHMYIVRQNFPTFFHDYSTIRSFARPDITISPCRLSPMVVNRIGLIFRSKSGWERCEIHKESETNKRDNWEGLLTRFSHEIKAFCLNILDLLWPFCGMTG